MSWIQENKFAAGVAAFTVVGAGALGYLLFQAKGQADEATAQFDSTSAELRRLQTLPIYPDQKNLATLREQVASHEKLVTDLRASLQKMKLPLEPISPEGFQDRLRASVTAYATKAAEGRLRLPEKFFLGMDEYQGAPPRPEAAPVLARQLKAIEFIMDSLISARAYELKSLDRDKLPEEGGAAPAAAPPPAPKPAGRGPAPAGGKTSKPAETPIERQHVQLEFIADQGSLQHLVNALTTATNQFFIVRNVVVKNEKTTGPERQGGAPAAAAEPAPAPEAAPAAAAPGAPAVPPATPTPSAPAGEAFEFIVGQEKIISTVSIEIVNFPDPPAAPEAAAPGKAAPKR